MLNPPNWRLAEMLGWTNLTEAGGALLGTPPDGAQSSRGQAAVPNWCSDWAHCGPLLAEHMIAIAPMTTCITAGGILIRYAKHVDRDTAARLAIVLATIRRLERGKIKAGSPPDKM